MDTGPVRFGIVGCGRIASNALAPALRSAGNAELVAAASRDLKRAEGLDPVRAYADYDALFEDEAVEAVYIGTHNGLHADLTLAALARGKHVLCEKPMACSAAEARTMVAAAEGRGCVLAEAFMYRHHPQIARTLELLDGGEIGDVRAVEAVFQFLAVDTGDVRFDPAWGGGAVYDVGCYCVSACRTLLRAEPTAARARAVWHPQYGIDMRLHGIMDFTKGRFGTVACGFDADLRNRVVVTGTKGTLTLRHPFVSSGLDTEIHLHVGGKERVLAFAPADTYRMEIEDFAMAVRERRQPLVGGHEGLGNAIAIDMLFEAARSD